MSNDQRQWVITDMAHEDCDTCLEHAANARSMATLSGSVGSTSGGLASSKDNTPKHWASVSEVMPGPFQIQRHPFGHHEKPQARAHHGVSSNAHRPPPLGADGDPGLPAALIDDINRILREYRASLPLTGRQVFYRLVATAGYAKTEKDYKSLLEKINRARRAGMIPWRSIRDDGVTVRSEFGYADEQHFYDGVKGSAEHFELDHAIGQDNRVELWVEANGMVPQAARAVEGLGVSVYSSGGFNSSTMKYDASRRFVARQERGQHTTVLHVGDHDPSGVAIYDNLMRDTWAFCEDLSSDFLAGQEIVTWKRIAITTDQAEELDLESAPPKPTDSRSNTWVGETYQAEALDPNVLADIITDAVEAELDLAQLESIRVREAAIRARLVDWVAEAMEDL